MDDPRWTERFIFEVHDPAGEVLLVVRARDLPEHALHGRVRDRLAEAACSATCAAGASASERPLAPARRPAALRRRRAAAGRGGSPCDDAGHGLRVRPRLHPHAPSRSRCPPRSSSATARSSWAYSHFVQAGRYEGWIEAGGRRFDVARLDRRARPLLGRAAGVGAGAARLPHLAADPVRRPLDLGLRRTRTATACRTTLCGAPAARGGDARRGARAAGARHAPSATTSTSTLVGPHRVLRRRHDLASRAPTARRSRSPSSRSARCCRSTAAATAAPTPRARPRAPLYVDGERWDLRPEGALGELVPHSILERSCLFSAGGRVRPRQLRALPGRVRAEGLRAGRLTAGQPASSARTSRIALNE